MRQSVPLAPIRSNAWEAASAPGVEVLRLNHDPSTGARTALIRSVPRAGIERKAQYHHCEEEFLCLAGRFTFDGLHWLRPWSYACYPPHVVHGARVSVPGGYLLYLRNSGSAEAYPVPEPASDHAYHLSDSRVFEPIVVLETTIEPQMENADGEAQAVRIRRHVLRAAPERDAAVTLWEFGVGARDLFRHFPAAMPLEVLIVRADSMVVDAADPACVTYGCYGPSDARPAIHAEGSVVALVHSGIWA